MKTTLPSSRLVRFACSSRRFLVGRRAEEAGLGQEKVLAAEMGDTWWNNSLEKTMYKMRMKKKLEKKAKKLEKKAKKVR